MRRRRIDAVQPVQWVMLTREEEDGQVSTYGREHAKLQQPRRILASFLEA